MTINFRNCSTIFHLLLHLHSVIYSYIHTIYAVRVYLIVTGSVDAPEAPGAIDVHFVALYWAEYEYEFRVFAENEKGLSKPSTASRKVRVNDPRAATLAGLVVAFKTMQVSLIMLMSILCNLRFICMIHCKCKVHNICIMNNKLLGYSYIYIYIRLES